MAELQQAWCYGRELTVEYVRVEPSVYRVTINGEDFGLIHQVPVKRLRSILNVWKSVDYPRCIGARARQDLMSQMYAARYMWFGPDGKSRRCWKPEVAA